MTTYHFSGYKGRAVCTFACPSCGKANRKRTFTVEHTVNPFNRNEDGSVRTPQEVRRNAYDAARLERDRFATEPLCASCENALPDADRRALSKRRREAVASIGELVSGMEVA